MSTLGTFSLTSPPPEAGADQIRDDPYLEPFKHDLRNRFEHYAMVKAKILKAEGSLERFSQGYTRLGFRRLSHSIVYSEWAPGARNAWLVGDFNNWHRTSHALKRDTYGVWSIELPDQPGGVPAIAHGSKVKLALELGSGEQVDRIPAWITRVVQQPVAPFAWDAIYWNPPQPHVWQHPRPPRPSSLRIYEAHVGMGSQEPKVGSYAEFQRDVLPHIARTGYNAIQLMGIMEHAYYASFGYQVTNFFAPTSRCGTAEDLKALIDDAHSRGILMLLDVVHSHASKNVLEGLNHFDGTDHQYFHGGPQGNHPVWDSRLFNYSHWEVLRFLLSNLRYWLEEFRFDGFRFDGVTSMIYHHHGIAHAFTDGYKEYFGGAVDEDAVTYLMLANDMIHAVLPQTISIAEEVSGMVGLCRSVTDAGFGFDYRLAMGIPDKMIELLSKRRDEDWQIGDLSHALSNRRYKEPTIAYCESHDQALVGDKTIAFWLMDKEMYTHMSKLSPLTPIIDRGLALHKILRLLTCGLGGEGYLTFMGNEFGHPEWIDFPRAGNNSSYHYARRQWNLAHDKLLRYEFLLRFEEAMLALEAKYGWLATQPGYISCKHDGDKVIAFDRGGLVFTFNFHATQSFTGYRIGVPAAGRYRVVLDSDEKEFGGHGRNDATTVFPSSPGDFNGRPHSILIYLPSRVALVFALVDAPQKNGPISPA